VQVLRLETEDGQGVYRAGLAWRFTRAFLEDNNMNEWHPGPEKDPKLQDFWNKPNYSARRRDEWQIAGHQEWFFGFLNTDQLLQWFPRQGLKLMEARAKELNKTVYVVRYAIHGNRVKKGTAQVAMHKKYSKLVERIPLSDFLG
jgi:hypothetical protein